MHVYTVTKSTSQEPYVNIKSMQNDMLPISEYEIFVLEEPEQLRQHILILLYQALV